MAAPPVRPPLRRRLRLPGSGGGTARLPGSGGRTRRRRRLAVAAGLLAFLAVLALRARPPSPLLRAPRQYQLAALIERQQAAISALRRELAGLQSGADALRRSDLGTEKGRLSLDAAVRQAGLEAGTTAVRGPAVRVVLDDSTQTSAPDLNDLVIHSQDVQAVINALWRSGAEAVAVNGQRVVATSAVECIGNTLLLDGSVYSPPYVAVGIGADQARFGADGLVRELGVEASTYGLRFDVSTVAGATAPAFSGGVAPRYAVPVTVPAR